MSSDRRSGAVFVVALEARPRPPWRWSNCATNIIDVFVQGLQPAPVMTHVELFIPPNSPTDACMFATYISKKACWGDKMSGDTWYVGGKNTWRAFPVLVSDVDKVRNACEDEEDAPYSICQYIPSVYPFRCLSYLVSAKPKTKSHCASLVARILKTSGVKLRYPAAWYSPSTLWSEVLSMHEAPSGIILHPKRQIAGILTKSSNDIINELREEDWWNGIRYLEDEATTNAGSSPDDVNSQQKLANCLMRYVATYRKPVNIVSSTKTETNGTYSGFFNLEMVLSVR